MAKKSKDAKKKDERKKKRGKKRDKKEAAKGKGRKKSSGRSAYFVHPAGLADSTDIGANTRIWAFAHVLEGAVVGSDCNICEGVFVENGAVLGNHVTLKNGVQVWTGVTCEDYVFVGPNATFTNDLRPRVAHPTDPAEFAKTRVCYGASIGANATIVAGVRIGPHSMIGAGTVVIRDVPSHALVVGNPARQIGWACSCGTRLGDDLACPDCGKAYADDEKGGLSPLKTR